MDDLTRKLVNSVLEWWNLHEFDVDGEYGEFNVYNETPEFVVIAQKLKEKENK